MDVITASSEKTEKDKIVRWFTNEAGQYVVEMVCEYPGGFVNKIKRNWTFGKTAIDESISIYWYRNLMNMPEHIGEATEDLYNRIIRVRVEDIKKMCNLAILTNLK